MSYFTPDMDSVQRTGKVLADAFSAMMVIAVLALIVSSVLR